MEREQMREREQEREETQEREREREQPENPRPWRSLLTLAAGIILLVVLALFMVWIGTLLT